MVSLTHILSCMVLGIVSVSSQTFCPDAPATPQDRRIDKTQLTFATYNTEFLFLVGYGQLKCPGTDCKWKSLADAQAHIQQTAVNIKAINADILQLNEVEDCAVLDALISNLKALGDDTYRGYMIQGMDSATGQNAALLTRVDPSVPLARSEERAPLPVSNSTCPPARKKIPASKGVAKHFYTTFQVAGFSKPVTLVGAHLLANPSDVKRCYEREGQAAVLSAIASRAVAEGHHVIMSGDLNDFSRTSVDVNHNTPISNALSIMEQFGTFFNVGQLAPAPSRSSQWWDKNHNCVYEPTEVSTLDHIVVSPSLQQAIKKVEFHTNLYQAQCGGFNSDHYPISIHLHE